MIDVGPVGNGTVASRSAIAGATCIVANLVILKRHVHVIDHVEVEVAVAVNVQPERAGAPVGVADSSGLSDITKRSVPAIVQEAVGTEPGNEQIVESVPIEVSNGTALSIQRDVELAGVGDIVEAHCPHIAVEPTPDAMRISTNL